MKLAVHGAAMLLLFLLAQCAAGEAQETRNAPFRRLVIVKVDGLNADLLYRAMRETNEETGKPWLPWFAHVFDQNGVVFENFYVRGISLSAPSWSLLDTGRHTVIRGNVEYDRWTGRVYDYLNVFPFYIGYAQKRAVDMPGVEVLDRAGIPLLLDRFPYDRTLQSFQLFQRGVSWITLKSALLRSVSRQSLVSVLESAAPISLSSSLSKQLEANLETGLRGPDLLYLDFFSGDVDHEAHATSDPKTLLHVLGELDALIGRVWTAIQQSPLANQTLLAVVSDHGMNNAPGVISQTFSLPDLLNSPAGGAHHVITDREQLSDYKLRGINPLLHRVITPSTGSFYLEGRSSQYPTAWLDIDGNERASIHLRNSALNEIHILLLELAKPELAPAIRAGVASAVRRLIDTNLRRWTQNADELSSELASLHQAIAAREKEVKTIAHHFSSEQQRLGEDKSYRRLRRELSDWQNEEEEYRSYLSHLRALIAFQPDADHRFAGEIKQLIPEMSLGDNNTAVQVRHYIAGPAPEGMVLRSDGTLDEEKSFRYVDYFALFASQLARNNPQRELSVHPIDFSAMALPPARYDETVAEPQNAYWLYSREDRQLVILQDIQNRLKVLPVSGLTENRAGKIGWKTEPWRAGLPLLLFEDSQLEVPSQKDRGEWLCDWHSEREWLNAVHRTRYSNGVIGITEELSPVGANVPGKPGISPVLRRYEQRRRELVQADFHVFASDHWNFNVRFPNPGGNHGGFLRISTHSVWLLAGTGLPVNHIEEPHDSLDLASTLLHYLGQAPPMPDRVVDVVRSNPQDHH